MAAGRIIPERGLYPSASFAVVGQTQQTPMGPTFLAEGDGQYDESTTFERAIYETARFGGGEIEVYPGTYRLMRAVPMLSGVTLKGHGTQTRLRSTGTHNFFEGADLDNVGFKDMLFDGSEQPDILAPFGAGVGQDGFNLTDVRSLTVEGLTSYRLTHRLGYALRASDVTLGRNRLVEHGNHGDLEFNVGPQGFYFPEVDGLYSRDLYSRDCAHSNFQPLRVTGVSPTSQTGTGKDIILDGVRTIRCGRAYNDFNGGGSGIAIASTAGPSERLRKVVASNLIFEQCADTHLWIVADLVTINNVVDRGSTFGGPLELQGRFIEVNNLISDAVRGYAIWYHCAALTGSYYIDCERFRATNIAIRDGGDSAIGIFNDSWQPFNDALLAYDTASVTPGSAIWPTITVSTLGVNPLGISAGNFVTFPTNAAANPSTGYLVLSVNVAQKELTLRAEDGPNPLAAAGDPVHRRGSRLGDIQLANVSVDTSRGPAVEIARPTGPVLINGLSAKNSNTSVLAQTVLTAQSSLASAQIEVESTEFMRVRDYMHFGIDVDPDWTTDVTGVGLGETLLYFTDNLGATGTTPLDWAVGHILQIGAVPAGTITAIQQVGTTQAYRVTLTTPLAADQPFGTVVTNVTRSNGAPIVGLAAGTTICTVAAFIKVQSGGLEWLGTNEFAVDAEELGILSRNGNRITFTDPALRDHLFALLAPPTPDLKLIRARQFGIFSIDDDTHLTLAHRFGMDPGPVGMFPVGTTFFNPFTVGHAAVDIYGDLSLDPGVVDLRGIVVDDDQAVPTTQRGIYLDKLNGVVRVDAVVGRTADEIFAIGAGYLVVPTAGPVPITANNTPGLVVSGGSVLGAGGRVGLAYSDPTQISVRDDFYDPETAPATSLTVASAANDAALGVAPGGLVVADASVIPQGRMFWLYPNLAGNGPNLPGADLLYARLVDVATDTITIAPQGLPRFAHGVNHVVKLAARPGKLRIDGASWDGSRGGYLVESFEPLQGAWRIKQGRDTVDVPYQNLLIESDGGFIQFNPGQADGANLTSIPGWRISSDGNLIPVPTNPHKHVGQPANRLGHVYASGAVTLFTKDTGVAPVTGTDFPDALAQPVAGTMMLAQVGGQLFIYVLAPAGAGGGWKKLGPFT